MRLHTLLLASCVTLASFSAQAETVNNLYQVREPLASQDPAERDQATQRALETLVLRLTGDPKAFSSSALAGLRGDPKQVISQFGYEAGQPPSLQVDFDPAATDNALRQAGLATWGTNRPSILAWWLTDSDNGSNLTGDAQPSAEPLRRAALHRGLPLRLPLADLSEQPLASAQALEGSDPTGLRSASERYGADALLAVHATGSAGQLQAKWQLWLGSQHEQGTAQGSDAAGLADAVMLAVSERLAPRFITKPGASTDMALQVQGMNLERYGQLSRLLDSFGGRLIAMEGDTATYQVSGSPEQLRAQLGLAKLQESPAPEAPEAVPGPATAEQPAGPAPLRFHW
ncbi:DUF2066 domain-containing protein [Pseudomonas typographi]|uniref:DUF2066 domain-containing protein n=1 Tax=Pseudomonas typographi TaxID=2715964 RepID=A0ABR7Z0J2_9PSED|nr:DUF2066 domain-containing protein [Pseudomonas typographi]MBD1550707.1 DUF2066 domain-containing protein [Pseudomonas typographi]MBD1589316.1 DUF2066 domain-containing protein [Pseudomonas typographi]MBD1598993.1 DUF2066 domain-containing protein [Pseudomonas typographi]